jgi:hypothetical protein
MKRALFAAAFLLLVPFGCGEDEPANSTNQACAAAHLVGEVCAGVPSGKLCDGAGCAGAACVDSVFANSDADLQAAVAGAVDGTCIMLGAGNFSSITLPPVRVGVYAERPSDTYVDSVTVLGGLDVELSGFSTSSVTFDAGSGRMDSLLIEGAANDGVNVGVGASVTISRSEIRGAARYGVSAFDAASVTLDRTVVEGNAGPGIWLQTGAANGSCDSAACNTAECPSLVQGTLTNSVFRDNHVVGISIVRALAVDIDNVIVANTTVGDNFEAGGGVSVAYCSTVTANKLHVLDSADFGFLIHDSSVTLDASVVDRNLRGIWIQDVGASQIGSVTIRGTSLDGNQGVGIGIDENEAGMTITMPSNVGVETSSVTNTDWVSLPVLVNGVSAGAENVGDGIVWRTPTTMTVLDSVTVSGSARQPVLIDGAVGSGSSVTNLVLEGGDENKGVLQQNFMSGTTPTISGTTPAVMTDAAPTFGLPSPLVPPGI